MLSFHDRHNRSEWVNYQPLRLFSIENIYFKIKIRNHEEYASGGDGSADGSVNGDDTVNVSSRGIPKSNLVSAQAAAVTNVVAGRMGNILGKGIGGLSSKLGGGAWF